MGLIILLSIVGLLLIIAEIILIPGIFITGLIGIGAVVGSCFMAFDQFGQTGGWMVSGANMLLCTLAIIFTMRSKTWKKMALNTSIDGAVQDRNKAQQILSPGLTGLALSRINPMGKARFGEEIYEVTAQDGWIDAQTPIEVVLVEENRIIVKTASNQQTH